MNQRKIRKVAVLGSGVMGSRIACHFANTGVQVLLLEKIKKRDSEIESVLYNLPQREVRQLNKLLDKIFDGKV